MGAALVATLMCGTAMASEVAPAVATASDVAADASDGSHQGLSDIVVTASKRSESIQKTPIAVTAITADGIEQQKISTFRDLSGRIPGLLAPKRSTAYTTQTYAIRGIGEIDTYPEPSVAVYVDDVYLARTVGSLYDTPDLERVEVLRGPQGTLYGRNSSAGAIRFITKEPTADPSLYVSGTYGSFENIDIKARLNGAILTDDKLNGALTVIRHHRDGWQYSVPLNLKVNDLDLWVLRGKLKSQLTDRLSITLSGDAMFDHSTQSYYTPVNQPDGVPSGRPTDPNLTWADTLPYNFTKAYGGSLTIKYQIDDHLTLKSVTAYRGINGPIYYDNDGVTPIKGDSYAGFRQYQKTQEFNLNGEYDRFNFVAGLYYFNEYFFNNRLSQATAGAVDDVGSVTRIKNWLRTTSYSAYGQFNYKATDQLTLTVGARYTTDHRKYLSIVGSSTSVPLHDPQEWGYDPDRFATLYGPYQVNFTAEPTPRNFSNFAPKFGLQYQWTPEIFQYLSWSKGFKSGGFDLRNSTVAGSNTPYLPQIVTTYEGGLKTKLLDGNLIANLAVFYNDISGVQVRATSPATTTSPLFSGLINAGDGESKGAEFELSLLPFEGLRLDASLAYLKTKYKTFTAKLPANVAGRTTLLGLDFPFSPKWQSSFAINYKLPFNTPGDWRVGIDGQYESRRFIDIYNTEQTKVRKQIFFNGTINYTGEDNSWSAGVSVKNIFDLRRGQAGGYNSGAGTQLNYYRAYNEPRTINFTVSKTF